MSQKKPEKIVDVNYLQEVSSWMHDADIHEISVENDDCSLHIVRRGNVVAAPVADPAVAQAPVATPSAPMTAPAPAVASTEGEGHLERSPMVGVAYLAPSPNDPNFVEIGKQVRVGDPLVIIEAMKVMNQIQATKAGVVKEILVDNAEPVEFDQPLVRID